jgi:hypothetical protein
LQPQHWRICLPARRRYKGREYTTRLLRRSFDEGDKLKKETAPILCRSTLASSFARIFVYAVTA